MNNSQPRVNDTSIVGVIELVALWLSLLVGMSRINSTATCEVESVQ